jgi:purine nucleosidase
MEKHLLLIDTDPGVDDALAILMALAHPRAEVLALTTTAGNVGLEHTTENALKLLDVAGVDVPVHPGCATPLVLPADDAAFVHGNDGFGDAGLPRANREAEREPAALAMIRLAWQRPGELTFVMLGPLTNLALALRIDPDLPKRVKRLVIMGGAVTGRGNVARIPVEFNVGFDPEAAHVVFSAWGQFELADWEATLRHGFPFATLAGWLRGGDARGRFYDAISAKTREFMRRSRHPDLWHAADALAMAMALEPHNVLAAHHRHVGVELTGPLTRGATVVDWDQRGRRPANARILETFEPGRFQGLMAAALGAGA